MGLQLNVSTRNGEIVSDPCKRIQWGTMRDKVCRRHFRHLKEKRNKKKTTMRSVQGRLFSHVFTDTNIAQLQIINRVSGVFH